MDGSGLKKSTGLPTGKFNKNKSVYNNNKTHYNLKCKYWRIIKKLKHQNLYIMKAFQDKYNNETSSTS